MLEIADLVCRRTCTSIIQTEEMRNGDEKSKFQIYEEGDQKVDKAVREAVTKGVPEDVVEETVEQAFSDSEEDVARE